MTPRQLNIAVAIALASAAGPTRAESADPSRAPAQPSAPLDLRAVEVDLGSGDPNRIDAALSRIESAQSAGRPAAPLVEQLLRRGATVPVLIHALAVAGRVGSADTSRAIAPYMRHRAQKVRSAAAQALGSTGGPVAEVALKLGLRAPIPALREVSAEALGRAGAASALPDLLTALVHGVRAASKASGQVCDAQECLRLVALLEQLGFDRVREGLAAVLSRPEEQTPIWVKLTVVDGVIATQTLAGRVLLTEARQRADAATNEALLQALDRALEQSKDSQPAGRNLP